MQNLPEHAPVRGARLAGGSDSARERSRWLDQAEQGLRAGRVPPPPEDIHPTGDGDYFAIGMEFLRYFVEQGGLQPTDSVLEIGSGLGRMALPLAHYLQGSRYLGLDITRTGVEWCTQNISAAFPNITFEFLDIHHPMYNPSGTIPVDWRFRFPLADSSFDFIFLTSVFTHLPRFAVKKYITEIGRLLRPGGRFFGTFYLAPPGSDPQFESFDRRFCFKRNAKPNSHYSLRGHPFSAIAYDEDFVIKMLTNRHLCRDVSVFRGSWHTGASELGNYQDLLIASRGISPNAAAISR